MEELKAGATTRGHLTQCFICTHFFASIHWHHTVPRSLGGHEDLQIPLCGSCHTALHAKASAVFALLKGGRKTKVSTYWADVEAEQRAERWLRILVSSMLYPPVDSEDKTITLPSLTVDKHRRFALEIIKRSANLTSVAQALLYCIDFTAASKGIQNNEENGTNNKRKKRNELW